MRGSRTSHLVPVTVLIVSFGLAASALGQTTTWIAEIGDWSDSFYWSDGEPDGSRSASISNGGTAIVTQPDENAHDLTLGGGPGQSGQMVLSSGWINIRDDFAIGGEGTGAFTQWGGALFGVRASVGTSASGWATYTKYGGNSSVFDMRVGTHGVLTQWDGATGGDHLSIGGGTGQLDGGVVTLYGGGLATDWLEVGTEGRGTLDIASPDAWVGVGFGIVLGRDAHLRAEPGSAINWGEADGGFRNESTDPEALAGLSNLDLVGGGGRFEVASAASKGFTDNFALHGLNVIYSLVLVDESNNGNLALGKECLFVKELSIADGRTLDLNALALYVDGDVEAMLDGLIADGRLFDRNGVALDAIYDPIHNWTRVPEPATLELLSIGALLSLRRRRTPAVHA